MRIYSILTYYYNDIIISTPKYRVQYPIVLVFDISCWRRKTNPITNFSLRGNAASHPAVFWTFPVWPRRFQFFVPSSGDGIVLEPEVENQLLSSFIHPKTKGNLKSRCYIIIHKYTILLKTFELTKFRYISQRHILFLSHWRQHCDGE